MTNFTIKHLGRTDFTTTWQEMRRFTEQRDSGTVDEFWLLEHNPVFTLGLAGKEEHILYKNHSIPIIRCDRGGQVTFHGPGQVIIYTLIDILRLKLSIRTLVERLECGIIAYLATIGIKAYSNRSAPGVYVDGKKIASLGLKVRKGCTYHGISFNLAMDTKPFSYINVCGYAGLEVTELSSLITQNLDINVVATNLAKSIIAVVYSEPKQLGL